MAVTTHRVVGMTCDHCVTAVRAELSLLSGVREVAVDLPAGTVTITADDPPPVDAVRAAVDEAGYELR